jgi:uncharacterized membrane protein YccF (DUF307 family)
MRLILNIIWLLFGGLFLAIQYVLAAIILTLTIVGIPFAMQSLKLAGYALWPFGRELVPATTRHKKLSVVGNVLWFVLGGWYIALSHLLIGAIWCLTIVGIPLGLGSIKMAGAALAPFGKEIVRKGALPHAPAAAAAG